MGLYFLWIIVGTGLYLYTALDTGIDAVHSSVAYLTEEQWYFGGILRSLHRYSTDGFILVLLLHPLREWAYSRYFGFRLYSWMTGVPLIWLAFCAALVGYWINWDLLSQFSATATTELLDWLPFFNTPTARNFMAPDSINDRFFTILVFMHIGIPLLLILTVWAHLNRISKVEYIPSKRLMLGTMGMLLLMALIKPAVSNGPANLALVPASLGIDWFVQFIHPLTDFTSPGFVWLLLLGGTTFLFMLPLLPHPKNEPIAAVDADNCNGCGRCYVDCPYAAISMGEHPDRSDYKIAIVDADHCASCGICAGSCPSSTPFRSQKTLITGIDMPQQPLNAMRLQLEEQLAQLSGSTRIVVFGCTHGADVGSLAAPDTAVMSLMCSGQLPPSFVEYALRGGADGVLVTSCRQGACLYRLGEQWTSERLARQREPQLRTRVPLERLQLLPASSNDNQLLAQTLLEFRIRIASQGDSNKLPLYSRRIAHHA